MNKILPLYMTLLLATMVNHATAQKQLSEDFNTGVPTGWSVISSGGSTWVHDANLGIGSSGAIIIDEFNSSSASSGIITTTLVDLTGIANPTLSFKVASIRSNFMAPVLKMQYSINGGAWQPLSSWGEYSTDNIINTAGPCDPRVVSTCPIWATVTYDLTALANTKDIRFSFEGDLINGGFLMIDDVWVGERNQYTLPYSTGFGEQYYLPEDWQEVNRPANQFVRWQRDIYRGSFGSNAPCIMFDNMSSNPDSTYTLHMVWLDLSTATKPILTFDYAYAMRTGKPSDELSIWYQIGSSGVPTKLIAYKDTSLTTTFAIANQFVPDARDWRIKTIDLSQFAGVQDIRFSLQNKSQNGNSVYIDNIQLYDAAATSIAHKATSDDVQLYPNPAQDKLYIHIDKTERVSLDVYDITGRQITEVTYSIMGSNIIVNTSALANGVYYMRINQDDKNDIKKVMINR